MSNIFNLDNCNDFSEKINLDDLYEKKQQHDLKQLQLYNKLLNRVHVRIKTTSRQKINEQYCWFVIPEVMIGVPKYDVAACIAYIIDKLNENDLQVSYIHPNTLFISWKHWVPSYVRNEFKKKTGIIIDKFGNRTDASSKDFGTTSTTNSTSTSNNPNDLLIDLKGSNLEEKTKRQYTDINSYKPLGNLIYDNKILKNFTK